MEQGESLGEIGFLAISHDLSKEYGEKCMVPDPINAEVASYTLDELLFAVPEALGLKTFAQRISICLLNDSVRVSMLFVNLCFHSTVTPQLNNFLIDNQNNRGISML